MSERRVESILDGILQMVQEQIRVIAVYRDWFENGGRKYVHQNMAECSEASFGRTLRTIHDADICKNDRSWVVQCFQNFVKTEVDDLPYIKRKLELEIEFHQGILNLLGEVENE